ncbi:MAG: hypothetical protein KDD48_07740, partial [Bdellovibrionales bacterium]|nr:hypothetical protein [Bdellovibrionales bacterium]
AVFGWMYYRNEAAKTEMLQIQNPELGSLIQSSDHAILMYLMGFFVLQFFVMLFFGLYFTHRVAGPIYRLKKYMEKVEETGNFSVFDGVREKDEFQSLFEIFVRLSRRLQDKEAELESKLKEVHECLDKGEIEAAKQELGRIDLKQITNK